MSSIYVKLAVTLGVGAAVIMSIFTTRLYLGTRKRKIHNIANFFLAIPELQMACVQCKDPDKVNNIINALIEGGVKKIQVISDFDMTLSKHHHNGLPTNSLHGVVETSKLLPDKYREDALNLKTKYLAIEIDPTLSMEKKTPYMIEWYTKANDLLIIHQIKQKDLKQMVYNGRVILRDEVDSFLKTLSSCEIPLFIFSAGLGDILEIVLTKHSLFFPNITLISNYMNFNQEGIVDGFKGDLIHPFNKNISTNQEHQRKTIDRPNILLIGDSLGDVKMSDGIKADNILKIGFLNIKIMENLPTYLVCYDIVLIDDQTMKVPNAILRSIIEQ